MLSLFVIPWIVYGLIFCKLNLKIKLELHKFGTPTFLYHLALYGTFILTYSWITVFYILYFWGIIFNLTDYFNILAGRHNENIAYGEAYTLIFIIGFLYSLVLPRLKNLDDTKPYRKNLRENILIMKNSDTASDKKRQYFEYVEKKLIPSMLFMETISNDKTKFMIAENFLVNQKAKKYPNYLLFELKNDKVYIGKVKDIGTPDEHILPESIVISPRWSGYREKDERKIVLTTDYVGCEETITVFKESDLLGIKPFNKNVYSKLSKKFPAKPKFTK